MSDEKKYNGYTNYETWAVCLWLDNDEGAQNYWQAEAVELFDPDDRPEDETPEERDEAKKDAIVELADKLKQEIRDDDAPEVSGIYADLLSAALGEVDWYEVAETRWGD